MKKVKISGLILSAGLSGRAGKFKPLLEYNGKSFIGNITGKLCAVCDNVIIVTGFKSGLIENHLRNNLNKPLFQKVELVFNENYETGMFSSLKCGIQNCSDADWVLYHFVDQPTLPEKFYRDFVKLIDDEHDWIQPVMEGRKGHPVLFNRKVMKRIIDAVENSDLRTVSKSGVNKKFWECNYKEIFDDIDSVEDYNNLIL